MQKTLLSAALLSMLVTGCGSSSSDPETNQPQNDGQNNGDPTNPDTGGDPTNPDTGGDPTNPDTGGDPTNPDTGGDPTNPDTGGDPTNPDTGGGSNTPLDSILGGDNITGEFVKFGYIDVYEIDQFSESEVDAGFFKLSSPISAAEIIAGFNDISYDVCDVTVSNLDAVIDQDFSIVGFPDIQFDSITAGDVITLSSAAGSFGELKLKSEFGFEYYESDVELPFPVPSVLTIDIPGAEYPAYSDVQVPAPEKLTGFNMGFSTSVDATANFTWNAATSTNTVLSLYMSNFDFSTGQIVSVDCILTDDGQFSFPGDTVAELNSAFGTGWTFAGSELQRTLSIATQQGDSILLITRESL